MNSDSFLAFDNKMFSNADLIIGISPLFIKSI